MLRAVEVRLGAVFRFFEVSASGLLGSWPAARWLWAQTLNSET